MARSSERIGEYRIIDEVKRTPSAIVYDAVHLVLPRRARIKVMAPPTTQLAVRALREPYILETLQHPGTPRVFESSRLSDGRPWFAREHVDGPTLAELARIRPLERREVIEIIRDVAEVLAHGHRLGVIHCGLRPERIVITQDKAAFPVCLPEWSDARAHDASPMAYVPAAGAWAYAAPELVAGEPVDDRVDVYALGVIAYRLLTGVMPTAEAVPTELRCPEAPRELTGMVDQMLSFDRWDRPSAAEVRGDLAWLTDAIATSALRMRKPRWTPQINQVNPPIQHEPTRDLGLRPVRGDDVD